MVTQLIHVASVLILLGAAAYALQMVREVLDLAQPTAGQ